MAFTVGDLIDGHYRVERRFAGGMGYVYIVRDELVGKRFAIKQLAELQATNKTLQERFRREAAAWLLLDHHPHIVQAHSYHPRPDGSLLILECIDGPSLDNLLRAEKKLSPLQVVRYSRQFCAAMHYAHTKVIPDRGVGILHRDIKPGNILITRDNKVKVTDFGLAKLEGEARITGEGQFVGTIMYSSPEQLRSAATVGRSSDVYSFGAVMYQMLTGKPPFIANNPAELYRLIQQVAPLPLGELCAGLDPALAGVVMRCLSKEVTDRYGDFADLEKALGGFEMALRDSKHPTCTHCGYVTVHQQPKCPVCSGQMAGGGARAEQPTSAKGWNCVCGARVSLQQKACPQCGRTRSAPTPNILSDDAPLPVDADLVHLSDIDGSGGAPQFQQLHETLLPGGPGAMVSPDSTPGEPGSGQEAAGQAWDSNAEQNSLVELGTAGRVTAWQLDRTSYTVGRGDRMRIRLKDPAIAAYQMLIVRLPCGWLVMNRPPGVFEVNGRKTDQRLLHTGDVVHVGATWLAFAGPPPSSDPLPPIPGHWVSRMEPRKSTVKGGGSGTRLEFQRPVTCTLELPGGAKYVTHGEPLRIGTSSLCEIRLHDASIAPVQAFIAWQSDGPHVINVTGSQIRLSDGQVVMDHLLMHGDRLLVGSATVRVQIAGDPLAPGRQAATAEHGNPRRMAMTVVAGPYKGHTATLQTGQPMILGRHSDCDMTIATDPYMSRRHLQLTTGDGAVEIKDLGSRHGFAIGQTTISGTGTARLGDVLHVGQTYFLIHFDLSSDLTATR